MGRRGRSDGEEGKREGRRKMEGKTKEVRKEGQWQADTVPANFRYIES